MKNAIIAIIALLVLGAGGWYFYTQGNSGEKAEGGAVAMVNGEKISRAEFEKLQTQILAQAGVTMASTTDEQKAQVKTQALDSLIAQALLRQAAKKAGVMASTTGVESQLAAVKAQLGSQDAYEKALAEQGMTEEALRTRVNSDFTIQAYLEQELHLSAVTVSDEEVKAVYDAAAAQQTVPKFEEVKDQVKQAALQQKQQALVAEHVTKLRTTGDVKVLI